MNRQWPDPSNPYMSLAELQRQLDFDQIPCGTSLAWEVPNKQGRIMEVWPVNPCYAVPHPADADHPNGYYTLLPGATCHPSLRSPGCGTPTIPAESMRREINSVPLKRKTT